MFGKWRKKMSCIHVIPYCSAIRRSTVVNPDTCYSGNGLQKHFAKSGVSAFCFSLKSQIVNILWCVGHRTPQLLSFTAVVWKQPGSMEYGYVQYGYVPINLIYKNMWHTRLGLQTVACHSLLSERSQMNKITYYMVSFILKCQKGQIYRGNKAH